MTPRRCLTAACISTVLASAALATAQDVATAEALFNRGLSDMQAGRYERGCPAIGESYRLDPLPGTLFTLAECEAKRGRLATAVARYGDYLAFFARLSPKEQARQRGREKIATAQREALAPAVPELTLLLPKDAPEGTVVKRDGVLLAAPSLGIPLPIDPGAHSVVIQPPGGPPAELRMTLGRGEKKQVTLEVKAAPPPAAPAEENAALAPPKPMPRIPASAPPSPPAPGGVSAQRVGAYVAGGVGLTGLAVGGITGALALGKKGTIGESCMDRACNAEGKAAADSAQTLGMVSTIGFGAGALGVGLAAVLFLTEPSSAAPTTGRGADPSPWVGGGVLAAGQTGAVLGIRGAF